jgi:hypothetical protein
MHYFLKHYREQLKGGTSTASPLRQVANQKEPTIMTDSHNWDLQREWPTMGADANFPPNQEGVQL